MSESASSVEASEEEVFGGTITISISEESVRYDSDLTLPETVFWIETVKKMIIAKVMPDKDS